MRADLSGIAKGYGVDLAARALEALGATDYLVEAGGEVRVRGRNAEGQPWRIGIERPDVAAQQAFLVVPLDGLSMATSGDYRIYFEEGGRRYSHEIDPATREPVRGRLASVTVVATRLRLGRCDGHRALRDGRGTRPRLRGRTRHGCLLHRARAITASLVDRQTPAFAKLGAARVQA